MSFQLIQNVFGIEWQLSPIEAFDLTAVYRVPTQFMTDPLDPHAIFSSAILNTTSDLAAIVVVGNQSAGRGGGPNNQGAIAIGGGPPGSNGVVCSFTFFINPIPNGT
jgi:hypothetical protein